MTVFKVGDEVTYIGGNFPVRYYPRLSDVYGFKRNQSEGPEVGHIILLDNSTVLVDFRSGHTNWCSKDNLVHSCTLAYLGDEEDCI